MSVDIYVLGRYPTSETLKDGMVQRIHAVDSLLGEYNRIYVDLSLRHPIFKTRRINDKVKEILVNPLFPFFIIFRFLLKANVIYAHSIHLFKHIPYFRLFLPRGCNLILDAHGAVPEEMALYGRGVWARYLGWIEYSVFRRAAHCICVSEAMRNHFKQKYPTSAVQYHILFTSKLLEQPVARIVNSVREQLQLAETDIVLLYSGNTQKWQNIALMLKSIKKIIQPGIRVIILSGQTLQFRQMLREFSIDESLVHVTSVEPKMLGAYYSLAHYGYILRDDIVVNQVANPTKMLEYLQFGLTPIVKSPNIGDYKMLGCAFLDVDTLDKKMLHPQKNQTNINVAVGMASMIEKFNMKALIEGGIKSGKFLH
ncbi:glycosyltransferase [Chitinophaga sp.]|uniref:glycosyltransferase n=1 Tax=Chitinophaga sp. TaxID=1869181 RepID=UPI0031DFE2DF